MPTASSRLSRDSWIDAALELLQQAGPDAVAVQPIARQLGATKGSFYWHFTSRDDMLRATLERWETVATDDVIASVEAQSDDPRKRAELLVAEVTAGRHPGELLLLAGTDHPDVAAAVERVTSRRIEYVAKLLRSAGLTPAVAQRRATLAYAAYLGHAQLVQSVPSALPQNTRGRNALIAELADLVLP